MVCIGDMLTLHIIETTFALRLRGDSLPYSQGGELFHRYWTTLNKLYDRSAASVIERDSVCKVLSIFGPSFRGASPTWLTMTST